MNRRNVLEVLGIGGALGVSTEALGRQFILPRDHKTGAERSAALMERSEETQLKIAAALEKLAREIRDNKVDAKELTVNSSLKFDEWLEHTVTVRLEIIG